MRRETSRYLGEDAVSILAGLTSNDGLSSLLRNHLVWRAKDT